MWLATKIAKAGACQSYQQTGREGWNVAWPTSTTKTKASGYVVTGFPGPRVICHDKVVEHGDIYSFGLVVITRQGEMVSKILDYPDGL